MPYDSELNADSATAAPVRTTSELPARLGDWQLVSLLGEGLLSRVFRARPASAPADRDALYAVKVLRERWQDSAAALDCFYREAIVGRAVSHPNLVSILSVRLN